MKTRLFCLISCVLLGLRWVSAHPPGPGGMVINELLADNGITEPDEHGEFDPWVELYNNGTFSIGLGDYYLSDDPDSLKKWQLPAGFELQGKSYFIIWADSDVFQNGVHCNFELNKSGGSVYLSDVTGAILDSVNYGPQSTDISWARNPNGTGDFEGRTPTFFQHNVYLADLPESLPTKQFRIYPNPVADFATIQLPTGPVDITLYQLDGKVVWQQANWVSKQWTFNRAKLPSGIYWINVKGEGRQWGEKIVFY